MNIVSLLRKDTKHDTRLSTYDARVVGKACFKLWSIGIGLVCVVLGSILVVSSSVFAQTPSCIVPGTFNTGGSLTLECTGAGTLSAAEINAVLSGFKSSQLACSYYYKCYGY